VSEMAARRVADVFDRRRPLVTGITYTDCDAWDHPFTPMSRNLPTAFHSAYIHELQHLRLALERLEGLGDTRSQTIDSLKRVVHVRISELESAIDKSLRAQATPVYESEIRRPSL
jgi:hypothetical protein